MSSHLTKTENTPTQDMLLVKYMLLTVHVIICTDMVQRQRLAAFQVYNTAGSFWMFAGFKTY